MAACGLQYAQANALAGRINAATQAGRAPVGPTSPALKPAARVRGRPWKPRCRYLGQMDEPEIAPGMGLLLGNAEKAGRHSAGHRPPGCLRCAQEPGRRNFMNEPETWDLLEEIRKMAGRFRASSSCRRFTPATPRTPTYARLKGYMTHDFFLPGLVVDAIENHTGDLLARWAQEVRDEGIRTVNMLGCHDGIPLLDLRAYCRWSVSGADRPGGIARRMVKEPAWAEEHVLSGERHLLQRPGGG